jgi:type IX secretion system PorP/SprF family membrane protein
MYTKQVINPAYVGSKGIPSIMGLYRKQWIGFDGAPESQLLAFNTPFFDPRVGFGLTVSRYQTGDFQEYVGNLAYSYDLINQKDLNLRFGIMGSLKRLSLDVRQPIRNSADPVLNHIGDKFPSISGNVGAGLYMNVKGAYIGLSVPNILTRKLGLTDKTKLAEEVPHFYGMAGAIIPIEGTSFQIYPNALFKYVQNAPYSLDLNLSAIYNNMITFGVSYRHGDTTSDSVDFLAHFQATPEFGIGLAYDLPISKIRSYNSGSVEVMLTYNLGKKNPDLTNPRFFF